jgi:CDGSH-type Zn-finger protein
MPAVFRPAERPWVVLEGALPEEVQAVVERCPTGALQFARLDGSYREEPQGEAVIRGMINGPLYVRGDVELKQPDGTWKKETRLALCRCGLSQNKPYCDNSHVGKFDASPMAEENRLQPGEPGEGLKLDPCPNGPVLVKGQVTIEMRGGPTFEGAAGALCRCGASRTKPFCDGAHKAAGFEAP